ARPAFEAVGADVAGEAGHPLPDGRGHAERQSVLRAGGRRLAPQGGDRHGDQRGLSWCDRHSWFSPERSGGTVVKTRAEPLGPSRTTQHRPPNVASATGAGRLDPTAESRGDSARRATKRPKPRGALGCGRILPCPQSPTPSS